MDIVEINVGRRRLGRNGGQSTLPLTHRPYPPLQDGWTPVSSGLKLGNTPRLLHPSNRSLQVSSSYFPLFNMWGSAPMDRLCAWNIRGLNWPNKQEDLRLFLHKQQVGFMALVETKIKQANFKSIADRVVPGWHSSHNLHYSPNGRIWMAWKLSLF